MRVVVFYGEVEDDESARSRWWQRYVLHADEHGALDDCPVDVDWHFNRHVPRYEDRFFDDLLYDSRIVVRGDLACQDVDALR